MTTIGSITPQTTGSSSSDSASLIKNYETFLTMLTTQLQHQDPMDPMDSSKFTEQLVQYSSVEQQIKSNEQLENLASMMTSSNALGVLNFVGTTVTVDGSQGSLGQFGSVGYQFTAAAEGTADITIRNAAGEIVHNQTNVTVSSGEQTYTWDGKDASGNRLAAGNYSIQITAKDAQENSIDVSTEINGVVQNVDLSSSEPVLIVNGQRVPTSQIRSVGITPSTTTS